MKNLKKVLIMNALFSFSCAILVLVFNQDIQDLFGFSNSVVLNTLGIGLLFFVAYLLYVVFQKEARKSTIKAIITADFLWVIACVLFIVTNAFSLNPIAYVSIGITALFVAFFGWQQRQINRNK